MGGRFEMVARYGYASSLGRRCPDCRNGDAASALAAVPRVSKQDQIERYIAQLENYGEFEAEVEDRHRDLAFERWGPRWANAARQRGLEFGTYHLGWRDRHGDAVVDGRPVWRIMRYESGGSYAPWFDIDEAGRFARTTDRHVRTLLLRTRSESSVQWQSSPFNVSSIEPRAMRDMLLVLGVVPAAARLPGTPPKDISYIGLQPKTIYEWLRVPSPGHR
jgi:hypothetical protein